MARKRAGARSSGAVTKPKATSYRLSPDLIARAQAILGTPTATSTIEEALDLVVFPHELMDGLDRAHGIEIVDGFPDMTTKRRW